MVGPWKTALGALCSCTLVFLIFISYGYLQTPTIAKWHLFQESLDTHNLRKHFHGSLIGNVSLQHSLSLKFPVQNVTQILDDVSELLHSYFDRITHAVEELKNNSKGWVDHGPTQQFFNAYNGDYFEKVNKLSSVRTIYANVKFGDVLSVLNTEHYHYGSSNCIRLEEKGIYGHGWAKTAYDDTCQSDVAELIASMPLNLKYLTTGLPVGLDFESQEVPVTFLHVVSNALVSKDGDIYVDRTKLLIQRCSQSKSTGGRPNPGKLVLYDEVFTIAQYWGTGFFHFTAENMVRIGPYIQFLHKNSHIKVHIVDKNSFIKKWLATLGIAEGRLISGHIKSSIVYAPAGGTCGRPAYFASNLLSMNLRLSFGLTQQPRDTVVVIKRTHLRFFRQHDSIMKMVKAVAEPLGYQVRLFSDSPIPSAQDTKEMFQRAVLILGPHGAGLSNMFLSQPGTVILEGLCIPMNLCYRNMAKVLGHRYWGLVFNKDCFVYTADDIRPYVEYFLIRFLTES